MSSNPPEDLGHAGQQASQELPTPLKRGRRATNAQPEQKPRESSGPSNQNASNDSQTNVAPSRATASTATLRDRAYDGSSPPQDSGRTSIALLRRSSTGEDDIFVDADSNTEIGERGLSENAQTASEKQRDELECRISDLEHLFVEPEDSLAALEVRSNNLERRVFGKPSSPRREGYEEEQLRQYGESWFVEMERRVGDVDVRRRNIERGMEDIARRMSELERRMDGGQAQAGGKKQGSQEGEETKEEVLGEKVEARSSVLC